jgi:hypothetical protein
MLFKSLRQGSRPSSDARSVISTSNGIFSVVHEFKAADRHAAVATRVANGRAKALRSVD